MSERLTDERLKELGEQSPWWRTTLNAYEVKAMAAELIERRERDLTKQERAMIARALRYFGADSLTPDEHRSLAMRFERYRTDEARAE